MKWLTRERMVPTISASVARPDLETQKWTSAVSTSRRRAAQAAGAARSDCSRASRASKDEEAG